ncbi:MAG: creatininase family protein [Candidatus Aminicenantes bacterium]|nr:creatininase family protein [Candidatus Aminicenantes bacterium]
MKTVRMEEMNWPDIKEAIEKGFTTAILAVGSTEQHGPHLPLITDSLIGDVLANKVAQKLGNALQAPTIRIGLSEHHLAFPGTVSLQPGTLKAVINDFVDSLKKHGFKTIVLLPSHGGNFSTVKDTVVELKQKHPDLTVIGFTDLQRFVDAMIEFSGEYGISAFEAGAHAGESETSFILALAEDLVRKDRYTPGYLGPLGEEEMKTIFEKGMPALSEKGVLGDPTKATGEKGKVYIEKMADFVADEISKIL